MSSKPALRALAALALLASAAPVVAQPSKPPAGVEQFVPRPASAKTKIDFSAWEDALRWFVLRMGRSLREMAGRPDPNAGSRIVYGHDSGYRLEGNRVAFNFMTDEIRTALTDYRKELEELPSQVDITTLPRNEQLAYWMNLHNVAVIEQIALAYPVATPAEVRVGADKLPLDEARFITVAGAPLSPKDIRTRIVYPNWSDPKVMYGFWRGHIGGPSISRDAFTGDKVGAQLDELAREFVNSLRGTERMGDTLVVSRFYLEAQGHYFRHWPADLRAHLQRYGDQSVQTALASTSSVDARLWEGDIADLNKGEIEPVYSQVVVNDRLKTGLGVPGAVARLLTERATKIERIRREDGPIGWVTVNPGATEENPVEEVK